MEGASGSVPWGELLIQGGYLPQQVRIFLHSSGAKGPSTALNEPEDSIKYYIVPSGAIREAVEKEYIECPSLWIDEGDASKGSACLRVIYAIGNDLQQSKLPFKHIRLQWAQKTSPRPSSPIYRSYIAPKQHLQLFRLVHSLFPTLQRWHTELLASNVVLANPSIHKIDHDSSLLPIPASPSSNEDGDHIRAVLIENGMLLERIIPPSPQSNTTTAPSIFSLHVYINYSHACLELLNTNTNEPKVDDTTASLYRNINSTSGRSALKCLRTLQSLEEALSILQTVSQSRQDNDRDDDDNDDDDDDVDDYYTNRTARLHALPSSSSLPPMPSTLFQSPAKAPRQLPNTEQLAFEGVALIQSCSSTQLREGAIMLQTAAASPGGSFSAIEAGAIEALVGAAATVLPSSVMGTTEQLTLLTLTISALLDEDTSEEAIGAYRLTVSLGNALQVACANPILLGKLLVALLQRPDVRSKAMELGLASWISDAYLRKSPLLEPLAAALLSPSVHGAGGKLTTAVATVADALGVDTADIRSALGSPMVRTPPGAGTSIVESLHYGSASLTPGSRLAVPKLALHRDEASDTVGSPTSSGTGGLTRATRREMKAAPVEWPSPATPWIDAMSAPLITTPATGSPQHAVSAQDRKEDLTAASEMMNLAEALGESLMAVDLPAMISHKRVADAQRASVDSVRGGNEDGIGERKNRFYSDNDDDDDHDDDDDDDSKGWDKYPYGPRGDIILNDDIDDKDSIPRELLEGPLLTSRQNTLQAHRIFTSAKSLQSLENDSDRNGTSSGHSMALAHGRSTTEATTEPDHQPFLGNANNSRSGRMMAETSAAEESFSLRMSDAIEVKHLLLQGLISSLPLMDSHSIESPTKDPSSILVAEVLSMPSPANMTLRAQESLRSSCLALLAKFAQRAEGAYHRPSAALQLDHATEPHVLLMAIGNKLSQLLAGASGITTMGMTQAADLMQVASEYIALVDTPSASQAIARYCLGSISMSIASLQSTGSSLVEWDHITWHLLRHILALLTPALSQCRDAEAGRAYLAVLLGDYKAAAMLVNLGKGMLLQGLDNYKDGSGRRDNANPGPNTREAWENKIRYQGRIVSLQRDILSFFASLAGLLGRQPAVEDGASPDDDPAKDVLVVVMDGKRGTGRRKVSRCHALSFFSFLIAPENEFVKKVLDHPSSSPSSYSGGSRQQQEHANVPPPPSSGIIRLRQGLFELLKAVFSAPGSPFIADKKSVDFYVRFHFIQFLKLYHNPYRDHQAPFLCRQHMACLLVLARANNEASPHVRHRFLQLSVVDFFVRELALEFETGQLGGGQRLVRSESSAGSGGELGVARISSAGKFTGGQWKFSPAGSAKDLVEAEDAYIAGGGTAVVHHKRRSSHGNIPLGSRVNSGTFAPVPKLQLPGSSRQIADGEVPSSGSGRRPGRRPSSSSRPESPRAGSRLGRDQAGVLHDREQQQQQSSKHPSVPKLGLAGLGLSLGQMHGGDGAPSPLATSGRGERISTLATTANEGGSAPLPAQQEPGGTAVVVGAVSSTGHRPLERIISNAISLDAQWRASHLIPGFGDSRETGATATTTATTAQQTSSTATIPEQDLLSSGSRASLPTGFAFTGDLDEDVELLEALEDESGDDNDTNHGDSDSMSSSSSTAPPHPVGAALLRPASGLPRRPPSLVLPPSLVKPAADLLSAVHGSASIDLPSLQSSTTTTLHSVTGSTGTTPASGAVPPLAIPGNSGSATPTPSTHSMRNYDHGSLRVDDSQAIPRSSSTTPLTSPDSPPSLRQQQQLSQQLPQRPSGSLVPRLAITPSMHSTLEARTFSAELEVAREAENARQKAGRSFFGELEKNALGKGKMQAAMLSRRGNRSSADLLFGLGASAGPEVSYIEERQRRLVYRDNELHLQVLELIFTLILDSKGQLDWAYCDQYPWDRKLQNIPFVLHYHLNHPETRALLPQLMVALHGVGSPALRLLRTLCAAFFRPDWYSRRSRISGVAGAYATVYRCMLPSWSAGGSVVLKLLDIPKHIQDRCAQVDFHSEVTILECLAGRPSACEMYDYGLDPDSDAMILVLKDYRCSLKQWRAKQPADPSGHLRLYYTIFREILVAVQELLNTGVVHFDLKCDNVLLEPLPGIKADEFWAPRSAVPPFRVVLGDFGESKMISSSKTSLVDPSGVVRHAASSLDIAVDDRSGSFGRQRNHRHHPLNTNNSNVEGVITSRARGTDAFKSPEMLLVGGALHTSHRAFDRRRRQGAGPSSDVWSLACLLYELVTGKLLFSDSDWLQLVARVTSPGMQLITDERADAISNLPGVLDLLHYMLIRDPALRPTLEASLSKLDAILVLHGDKLPMHRHHPESYARTSDGDGWRDDAVSTTLQSRHRSIDRPLPIPCLLPFLPRFFLGTTSTVTAQALRSKQIRRLIIISQYQGHLHGSKDPLRLSSLEIMSDEELAECAEACSVAGTECIAIHGAESDEKEALSEWLDSALEVLIDVFPAGGALSEATAGTVLATQSGLEGDMTLLAVSHLVKQYRASKYLGMVRAAHWGIDMYMDDGHLDALELLK